MTSPQTGNREFRDEIIAISSLVVTSGVIEDYSFINCRIVGPAVLAVGGEGVSIVGCSFEADVNSLFWEVDPETRPRVFGAVALRRVSFVSCTFQNIGLAGTRELRALLESAVS